MTYARVYILCGLLGAMAGFFPVAAYYRGVHLRNPQVEFPFVVVGLATAFGTLVGLGAAFVYIYQANSTVKAFTAGLKHDDAKKRLLGAAGLLWTWKFAKRAVGTLEATAARCRDDERLYSIVKCALGKIRRKYRVEPECRRKAEEALLGLLEEEFGELGLLEEVLGDESDVVVHKTVIGALSFLPPTIASLPMLRGFLSDANEDIRRAAAEAVAEMGADGEEVVPDLVRLLASPNSSLRICACEALGAMGNNAVITYHLKRTQKGDKNEGVRHAARAALKKSRSMPKSARPAAEAETNNGSRDFLKRLEQE